MKALLKKTINKKSNSVFKNTNFMLLFSGKLISLLGDQIYIFALSWYVLSITHSSLKMGTLMMVGILPYVIMGPFAGIIADKIERKKIIVYMDLVRGSIVIFMALLLYKNYLYMPLLYIGTIILSLCGSVFNPAASAIIPNIVDKENLTQATSIDQFVSSLCNIVGMLTGSILYGLIGIVPIFIINAISYFISAVLESNVRIQTMQNITDKYINKQAKKIRNIVKELGAGYDYLKNKKSLFVLFIFFATINFILFPIGMIFIPYIFNVILKSTAIQLSIAQGTVWLGFIAGSFIVPNLPPKSKIRSTLISSISIVSTIIMLLSIPIMPIFREYFSTWTIAIFYAILSAVLGLSMTFINIPIIVTFQKTIPDNIRGRVMALFSSVTSATIPIGYILGGFIAQAVPMYILFIIMSVIMMVIVFEIKNSESLKIL